MRKHIGYIAGTTPRITVSWRKFLKEDETIVSSGWTLERDGGEMLAEEEHDDTSSTVLIQKGRPMNQYALSCFAETSDGRTLTAHYWLNCNAPPQPEAEPEQEPELTVSV